MWNFCLVGQSDHCHVSLHVSTSRKMVASKVVIVVFTILFMGFISLLLIFNIYSAVHDSTQVTDIEDQLVHQELVFDLDSKVNTSCPYCDTRSLRALSCDNETFVIVVGVNSVKTDASTGKHLYFMRITAEMKSIPRMWESLSRMVVQTETANQENDGCLVQLVQGREYLVTGSLDPTSQIPTLSSCDYILDWSRLQTTNRHRIFAAFNSMKC